MFCVRLLSILITPLVVICFIPIYIFRSFVLLWSKIFRKDLIGVLNSRSTFLAMQGIHPNPRSVLLTTMIVEGGVSKEICIQKMEDILREESLKGKLKYGKLQEYLTPWMGFLFWTKEKDFRIQDHVKVMTRRKRGQVEEVEKYDDYSDGVFTKELKEIERDLLKGPFCPGRSPWELILIKNVQPKFGKEGIKYDAMILKMHHSLGDGFSLLKMLGFIDSTRKRVDRCRYRMTDLESGLTMKDTGEELVNINRGRNNIQESRYAGFGKNRMKEILFDFYTSIRTPFELIYQIISMKPDENDFHLESSELFGMENLHVVETERISLQNIKEIKKRFGVRFQTVIFAAITEGIRKAMEKKGKKVPPYVTCALPFPFPGHPDKITNHWSAMTMKFPVVLASSEERLKVLDKKLDALGNGVEAALFFKMQIWIGSLFYWMVEPIAPLLAPTGLLTDMPGPLNEVSMFGGNVLDMYFNLSFPRGRVGLILTSLSYNGYWKINVGVDHAILSSDEEAQDFADGILAEIRT